jgi:phosphatidylglycerophosphate synthase
VSRPTRSQFVLTLLTNLQQSHYSPAAWGRFFTDSWQQARATASAHPQLVRSWARGSSLMIALAAIGVGVLWLLEGPATTLQLLPALLICLALQQGDVYVHLGLNWRPDDDYFRERLGLPTTLTLARGVLANLLLAHLLSGLIPASNFTLGVFLLGIVTDSLDGYIARRARWQTRLGGYLDSEADLYLYSSVSLCATRAGVLPAWVAAVMLLRFAAPLMGAVLSYFVAIRQVDLTHTLLGRAAGVAQAALLITILAPPPIARALAPIHLPLLVSTLALLVLAPLIEIRRNLVLWRASQPERPRQKAV